MPAPKVDGGGAITGDVELVWVVGHGRIPVGRGGVGDDQSAGWMTTPASSTSSRATRRVSQAIGECLMVSSTTLASTGC